MSVCRACVFQALCGARRPDPARSSVWATFSWFVSWPRTGPCARGSTFSAPSVAQPPLFPEVQRFLAPPSVVSLIPGSAVPRGGRGGSSR
eukprot:789412-Lingulodinium_polyedra.AAC.1